MTMPTDYWRNRSGTPIICEAVRPPGYLRCGESVSGSGRGLRPPRRSSIHTVEMPSVWEHDHLREMILTVAPWMR
jgi:hypothetical protein